jgi:hypothetical protein
VASISLRNLYSILKSPQAFLITRFAAHYTEQREPSATQGNRCRVELNVENPVHDLKSGFSASGIHLLG